MKTHIFGGCTCCTGIAQRLRYLMRSLGLRPFQLALMAFPADPPSGSPMHSFAYLDCGNGKTGTRFNAYTYSGDPVSRIVPAFDMNVDTEQTTLEIKNWLSRCTCVPKLQASDNCLFKPTRIIDISNNPEVDIVVKSTSGLDIPSYVCLSYCWGGPQALKCTSSNFEPSQSWVVPYDRVPAAFKDTFKIAEKLGFRFVWIDSLCIIQDDPADLKTELLAMPNIFKHADLTVCASSSKAFTEGFLQQRPDFREKQIMLNLPEGTSGTAHLDSYTWWAPPVPEPLAQRVWAYQERWLSPRLLEYGWRTSRWSCSCQKNYSGNNNLSILKDPSRASDAVKSHKYYSLFSYLNPPGVRQFSLSGSDLFNSWTSIIRKYSALKLTFPQDRLAAISGVAIELHRATGVGYLTGLWDHERLPSFLLWRTERRFSERRMRPDDRRAPSWSWAAIDEGVIFQHSRVVLESFKIVDVGVSGDFDRSVQGFMKMRGPVRQGLFWHGSGTVALDPSESHITITKQDGHELLIWPDCVSDIVHREQGNAELVEIELTLIAVGRAHTDHGIIRGLMLLRDTAKESSDYRRVGMFQARDEGDFTVDNWGIEEVGSI
ncbi:heterokaryon incompatibility protein-domain-containing protein [Dactylonectria estremocensis]|uniref:Heterokaryon incompatibility protein-domain-containing protein n=1 Tax=Dactylonectria estremocensis TaxID=1079267 RepID=A0A9P9EVC6_9HYPO|nr:heterokaryon incompatibility protein-domain-containing protein [Dactylonectria estremocensis]